MTKTCDYAAPARAIYWGARQIMLEVGALQPGDIVDYEIAKKGFTYALLAATQEDDSKFTSPMSVDSSTILFLSGAVILQ